MNHHYRTIHPLVPHQLRYARAAGVIPLHSHLPGPRAWLAIGFFLFALAVSILIWETLFFAGSGHDFLGQLARGSPWW